MLRIHPEKVLLFALPLLMLAACKKDDTATPAGPGDGGVPPPAAGTPNSEATWGIGFGTSTTSLTNWACLENGTLTIFCRPSTVQYLRIDIPGYTGPGVYVVGAGNPWEESVTAGFRSDDQYMSPMYTPYADSVGVVEITAFDATHGLSGTFDMELHRAPSDAVHLVNGVLDGIRARCPDGSPVFSYSLQPFVPTTQVHTLEDGYDENITIARDDEQIVVRTRDTWNVPNPAEDLNSVTFSLPRSLAVGELGDPSAFPQFSFSYMTPGGGFHDQAHADNSLTIAEHDTVARAIAGTYRVALSGGQTATGSFDLLY
jgi:hypothetical protein